ncbi:MAG TPA: hypothetical protein VFV49_18310 [Thermoanaerobaculia bacterium]|nr:hypothetical protein [Thermoanaerobaculia bacterium]
MKKLLFLLLLALPSFAQSPAREPFPSDYKASPCAADGAAVCGSFQKERMSESGATFRGFDIKQEWVNEHWDEMRQAFLPLCAKMGSCFTIKGNDWVFCVDLLGKDFLAACDRFPADSEDRRQCGMFSTIYFMGLGGQSKLHKPAQECAAAQPASGPRKLEVWIEPATYKPDFHGPLTAYAYDSETHIPVRAHLSIDGGKLKAITNGIIPTVGYPVRWRAGFKSVPNAQGHRDFVPPSITFSAAGYEPVTIPIAMEVPKLTVQMTPSPSELKPGMNTITVTTIDAATNQPVEMRVMAGDRVLGKANTPLQLEWKHGQKRPEIWVTSLWDRYSDVVVAP